MRLPCERKSGVNFNDPISVVFSPEILETLVSSSCEPKGRKIQDQILGNLQPAV